MLPVIQSLWVGAELSVLERLTVASYLANGHRFHLYVYGDVKGVPAGVDLLDANEIIPAGEIFRCRQGSYAIFADWFRWKLLEMRGGIWVDMDLVCIKPFDFQENVLFGMEAMGHPNIAVLRFPANHELVSAMVDRCENPHRFDPGDRARHRYRKLVSRYLKGNKKGDTPWGQAGGPPGFRKMLIKHGMLELGKPFTYFYPIHCANWMAIFDDTLKDDRSLFSHTYALHLWNEMLRQASIDKNSRFHEDSLIEYLKARYLCW